MTSEPARMYVATEDPELREVLAESWVNPNVGNLAVLVAILRRDPARGPVIARSALRRLGRGTGHHLITSGILPAAITPEVYASHLVTTMTRSGLAWEPRVKKYDGWFEVSVDHHPLAPQLGWLNAPSDVCDVSTEWDRGVLDCSKEGIDLTHPGCLFQGGSTCTWRMTARGS